MAGNVIPIKTQSEDTLFKDIEDALNISRLAIVQDYFNDEVYEIIIKNIKF